MIGCANDLGSNPRKWFKIGRFQASVLFSTFSSFVLWIGNITIVGFEPRISGIRIKCRANCATNTDFEEFWVKNFTPTFKVVGNRFWRQQGGIAIFLICNYLLNDNSSMVTTIKFLSKYCL